MKLLLISIPGILLISLLVSALFPLQYQPQPLFLSELINHSLGVPWQIMPLFWLGNLIVIFLIGKQLFNRKLGLLSSLIYSITPYFAYLTVAGSFYLYLSFWFLLLYYALLKSKQGNLFKAVVVISVAIICFSSLFGVVLLTGVAFLNQSRIFLKSLAVSIIILAVFCSLNFAAFKNIASNQITFLADPAVYHNVDIFQGESKAAGYKIVSRLVENKYLYISKYLLLKFLTNINPLIFFTAQEKMLGFSFTPPFYLGLLIPFFFGLYKLLQTKQIKKLILLSVILTLPSFFGQSLIDLNRVVILAPVILFVIIFGLWEIYQIKSFTIKKTILGLMMLMLIVQVLSMCFDIRMREYPRFLRYQSNFYNFSLGKQ